jgi:hypothetical protein
MYNQSSAKLVLFLVPKRKLYFLFAHFLLVFHRTPKHKECSEEEILEEDSVDLIRNLNLQEQPRER